MFWLYGIIDFIKRALIPIYEAVFRIPKIQFMAVHFKPVHVGKAMHNQCWIKLGQDQHGKQGMVFTFILSPQKNSSGTIEIIQLVKANRERKRKNGAKEKLTTNGEWALDGTNPYITPVPVKKGAPTVDLEVFDSPGSACAVYLGKTNTMSAPLEYVSNDDEFMLFAIWKPKHLPAVSIPIGHIHWHWKGVAKLSGETDKQECKEQAPDNTQYAWHKEAQKDESGYSKAHMPDYFRLPIWKKHITSYKWTKV
ncbi:MAG: hypothetical protein JKY71_09995 [Alphaproteobacteria bacterium]|nr:hypothetical protein [Alphaproteobacteria bacterium]